jgi:uncharacterized protein (DUF427 family)
LLAFMRRRGRPLAVRRGGICCDVARSSAVAAAWPVGAQSPRARDHGSALRPVSSLAPTTSAARRSGTRLKPRPDPVDPGQESVWRFPRPAVAEASDRHVYIIHQGTVVADTRAPIRTLETSHPPSWYLPPADVATHLLRPSDRHSFCEWKGHALYWHLDVGGELLRDVAWSYPDPTRGFANLRDHFAFYAAPLDLCSIDGEKVRPQPGDFYGGWITSDLAGPFKGIPGSMCC